jgi:hypothetical protein
MTYQVQVSLYPIICHSALSLVSPSYFHFKLTYNFLLLTSPYFYSTILLPTEFIYRHKRTLAPVGDFYLLTYGLG